MLAELAQARGWEVHLYDAKSVLGRRDAGRARAERVLERPRARLGPPWTKDHRTVLAATVVCS